MENELMLTFDIGTQSMRGMLVNKKGEIEALKQIVYPTPYYSKHNDWAEQKADYYFEVLCQLSNQLKEENSAKYKQIIGVTLAVFRDSTVCLDKDNKPLNDLILWLDKREVTQDEFPFPKLKKFLFKLVGVYDMVDTQRCQSVCNYLMVKEKQLWQKTNKYVLLSTYMNYLLTGNLIDSDANQIAHIPFDYKKRRWQKKNDITRMIYDVEIEKLCEICQPGDIIGQITKKCSELSGIPEGLPLIATGSDKGCETIGLSVIKPNQAAISFGTSATIQFTSKKYFEPKPFCPGYPAPLKGYYNGETQIYRGYWMLSWFKKNFVNEEYQLAKQQGVSIETYLDRTLPSIPAGCDGLLLTPFWSPGVSNPNAKGAIIGYSDVHSKYHLFRAIIEGINYGLMDGLFDMEKSSKQKIDEIFVAGGGSQSDEICQIAADMLGLPVKRIQTHEACGLGSSMIGFVALNRFEDINQAIKEMVHVSDVFVCDKATHEFYLDIYQNNYRKLTTTLEPFYKRYKMISRRK